MFEHVGVRNYRDLLRSRAALPGDAPDGGLFLLHTHRQQRLACAHTDPWIERYIFPNSMLPSAAQIAQARRRPCS